MRYAPLTAGQLLRYVQIPSRRPLGEAVDSVWVEVDWRRSVEQEVGNEATGSGSLR